MNPPTSNLEKPNQLSIVVPVGNMEGRLGNLKKWIFEALNAHIEIILILDSSNDKTEIEIEQISSQVNSAKLKIIKGNDLGPGGARNRGIRAATGTWLAFWDSDDLGDVSSLLKITEEINRDDTDLFILNYYINNGSISIANIHSSRNFNSNMRQVAINPGIWRMVFRRTFIERVEFGESNMGEDQIFLSRVLRRNPRIKFIDLFSYTYFINLENQLTASKKNITNLRKSINELIADGFDIKTPFSLDILIIFWRQCLTLFLRGNLEDKRFTYRCIKHTFVECTKNHMVIKFFISPMQIAIHKLVRSD